MRFSSNGWGLPASRMTPFEKQYWEIKPTPPPPSLFPQESKPLPKKNTGRNMMTYSCCCWGGGGWVLTLNWRLNVGRGTNFAIRLISHKVAYYRIITEYYVIPQIPHNFCTFLIFLFFSTETTKYQNVNSFFLPRKNV